MPEQSRHIYRGVWMVKFRGKDIIGTLTHVGEQIEGKTPMDTLWTLEAHDGPIVLYLTAPRRRFRRPPHGSYIDEQRAVEQQEAGDEG